MSTIFQMILLNTILSSVMILFVLLAKGAFKNKIKPALVSMLWVLVMVRLLVPYSIESPIYLNELLPEQKQAEADMYTAADDTAETLVYDYTPAENLTADNTINTENTESIESTAVAYDAQPAYTLIQPTTWQRAKTAIKSINIKMLTAYIWIITAAAILCINIMRMIIFSLKQTYTMVQNAKVMQAFSGAKNKLGIKRKVAVFITGNITVPMAYSLLSPKILLPQSMAENMNATKTELIFMHELMHIKRLDIMKNYLWLAAKAIYWFNPLVWVAYRQYVSDTEICCDYHVMKKLDEDLKISYSQSLLDAAKMINKKPVYAAPYMLTFCESETKLRRRIMNILQPIKQSKKQTAILAIMTMIIALCCFTTACYGTPINGQPAPLNTPTPEILHLSNIDTYDDDTKKTDSTYEYAKDAASSIVATQAIDENWSQTREVGNKKVTITLDIEKYNEPVSEKMYVNEAVPDGFSQAYIQEAAEHFLGDEYYDYTQTKSDYAKRIADYEQRIEADGELDDEMQKAAEETLQNMRDEMENAPVDNVAADTSSNGYRNDLYGSYLELKSYDDEGSQNVFGVTWYKDIDVYSMFFRRDLEDLRAYELDTMYESNATAEDLKNIADYEPLAYETAQYIAGKAISLQYTTRAVYVRHGYGRLVPKNTEDDILYTFYYTPISDNIPTLFGVMASLSNDELSDDNRSVYLGEYIRVTVDQDGVRGASYHGKMTDLWQLVSIEDCQISIEQAITVFKEHIFDAMQWNAYPAYEIELTISNVDYGMVYVKNGDTYQSVPAYGFKGYFSPDGELYSQNNVFTGDTNTCYMLVSAIDGSVIDFYK